MQEQETPFIPEPGVEMRRFIKKHTFVSLPISSCPACSVIFSFDGVSGKKTTKTHFQYSVTAEHNNENVTVLALLK